MSKKQHLLFIIHSLRNRLAFFLFFGFLGLSVVGFVYFLRPVAYEGRFEVLVVSDQGRISGNMAFNLEKVLKSEDFVEIVGLSEVKKLEVEVKKIFFSDVYSVSVLAKNRQTALSLADKASVGLIREQARYFGDSLHLRALSRVESPTLPYGTNPFLLLLSGFLGGVIVSILFILGSGGRFKSGLVDRLFFL